MVPSQVFEVVSWIRERVHTPIVLMGYYNPIFRMGEASYLERAAEAGVDGLIVPDLPFEESFSLQSLSQKRGIDLIQLVGPTTNDARMKRISSHSSGFLYLVSALGTTGERDQLAPGVSNLIERARKVSMVPVAVGFGISTPEQVSQVVTKGADGAIVGSAIVKKIIDGESSLAIRKFVRELKNGCKKKGLE